jgi:hypothetical protein
MQHMPGSPAQCDDRRSPKRPRLLPPEDAIDGCLLCSEPSAAAAGGVTEVGHKVRKQQATGAPGTPDDAFLLHGMLRARLRCRFALPLIRFVPYFLIYSVPLFLKRQCDRTLGVLQRRECAALVEAGTNTGFAFGWGADDPDAAARTAYRTAYTIELTASQQHLRALLWARVSGAGRITDAGFRGLT